MQKVLKWNNRFQKEQKSIQEDKVRKGDLDYAEEPPVKQGYPKSDSFSWESGDYELWEPFLYYVC